MPALQEISEADVLTGTDVPLGFADILREKADGRLVVTFDDSSSHQRNLDLAVSLMSALGPVLSICPVDGCWSDLGVRPEANPMRTHGIGENPLHIDLVDREYPPRYIAFYCVRNDPKAGGATALSDLRAAVRQLDGEDRAVLSEAAFHYWTDEGVCGVGDPLPSFPIIPAEAEPGSEAGAVVRFTSKMLPHLRQGELVDPRVSAVAAAEAFDRLVGIARSATDTYPLHPGQMMIFDQYRYAHGRMPLGPGQDDLPDTSRRLLKQAYVSG